MIQVGIRGPKAEKWYFKARTFDNREFFLDEEGRPCKTVVDPYEPEDEADLASESKRRRARYANRHGYEIERVAFQPKT